MSVTASSEFAGLPAVAADYALDVAIPIASRVSYTLADGRTLSAIKYGTEAPQVVFLHGAGLNAHTWDATVLALGIPAIAIDLAGHGDSSWREDAAYSPANLASDVVEALPSWVTAPVTLVGQSLGGLTAAAVASHAPQLANALIVIDITPGIRQAGGPAELRSFYEVTDFASVDDVVDRAISFGLGGPRDATTRAVTLNTRVRPDGRVEWKHHFARLVGKLTSPESAASVLGTEGWDDFAAVAVPFTLVRGTAGYIDADALAEFVQRVPTAEVIEVPAPHNVQEVLPAQLADIIRDRILSA